MNDNSAFIMVYKALFSAPYEDMPLEDKVAYSILHDRHMLSLNNEFCDDEGKVCVIYPATDMGNMLGCTRQKAGKIMDRLENRGLIRRRMKEKGMPYYIYVLPLSRSETSSGYDYQQGDVIADNSSNTDDMETDSSDIDHRQCDFDDVCCYLLAQWEYRRICELGDDIANMVGRVIDVAASIMCATADTIYIAGEARDTTDVQICMQRLTSVHIVDIARRIINYQDGIDDIYQYIVTTLYNSGAQVPHS